MRLPLRAALVVLFLLPAAACSGSGGGGSEASSSGENGASACSKQKDGLGATYCEAGFDLWACTAGAKPSMACDVSVAGDDSYCCPGDRGSIPSACDGTGDCHACQECASEPCAAELAACTGLESCVELTTCLG